MSTPEELVRLLLAALEEPANRLALVSRFQTIVWDSAVPFGNEGVDEILHDLAVDLDYYEPNPEWRSEDPSFYGDARFKAEVGSALTKLAEQGVQVRGDRET
jgi:hypothetical protein